MAIFFKKIILMINLLKPSSSVFCVILTMRVGVYLFKANRHLSCKTDSLRSRPVNKLFQYFLNIFRDTYSQAEEGRQNSFGIFLS